MGLTIESARGEHVKLWGWRIAGNNCDNGVLRDVGLLDLTKASLAFGSHTTSLCLSLCNCILARWDYSVLYAGLVSYET